MSTVTVLEQNGTQRAAEVIELAALAGLELAAAATLLEKESSGGRNVFGRDAVETGGLLHQGGSRHEGVLPALPGAPAELGAQGVGPTQLTFPPFQDRADRPAGAGTGG